MPFYSIAPMLDLTTSAYRRMMRLITHDTLLYTEMIVDQAITHGDVGRFLTHDPAEHPLALQIGGSDPKHIASAVQRIKGFPFDEINLNAGCPSVKVQAGCFGAALMQNPQAVADCLNAMKESGLPVSVKTRLGLEGWSFSDFMSFVTHIYKESGVKKWIIHARYADLSRRSTSDNITKQPLHYDLVYQFKKEMPHLKVVLNGGVTSLEEGEKHHAHVDGVMIGRAAYLHPLLFNPLLDPYNVLKEALRQDLPHQPLMGLLHGQKNARKIRQMLADKQMPSRKLLEVLDSL